MTCLIKSVYNSIPFRVLNLVNHQRLLVHSLVQTINFGPLLHLPLLRLFLMP